MTAAFVAGEALAADLRDAGGAARVTGDLRALGAIADHAGPELRALGDRLTRAEARLDTLSDIFDPPRRAALAGALAAGRHAVATATRVADDVRALVAAVERGDGTIGGLLHDQELFDDLHDSHRILKAQPWRFILKPTGPDKRRPSGPPRRPR